MDMVHLLIKIKLNTLDYGKKVFSMGKENKF